MKWYRQADKTNSMLNTDQRATVRYFLHHEIGLFVLNLLFILRAPLISLQFSIEFLEKYCSLTFLSIYRSCITTSTDTERISKLRGVSTKICRLRSEATRQEKSSQNCMVWPSIFSFKSSICSKKSFVWFTISLQGCLFHKIGL